MTSYAPERAHSAAGGNGYGPSGRSQRGRGPISAVPYLPGLDGMRALAVVAVMIYHANSAWLPGGYLGVEVFFVISGYLITLLLIAEHERTGTVSLKSFWVRRFRRLLPALFVMLALLMIWSALFERDTLGKLRGDVLAGVGYISNWYQIWTGAGYTAQNDFAPLRHLWSLAVEEQFYVIWPLVMILLLRPGTRRIAAVSRWLFLGAVAVTVFVALAYHSGPNLTPEQTPEAYWTIFGRDINKINALYLSTITRAGGLLLGAAFAMIWRPVAIMRGPLRDRGRSLDIIGAVGLLGLAVLSWFMAFIPADGDGSADALLFRGGLFITGLATLAVIAAVTHRHSLLGRGLSTPTLKWIGTRSYGLYLYHWPIFQIIRNTAGTKLALHEFVLAMAATALITEASYRLVETPIRKGRFGDAMRSLRSGGLRAGAGRPRQSVVIGTGVAVALTLWAGAAMATADLVQNEVQQSLDAGQSAVCDVLAGDCDPAGTNASSSGSDGTQTDTGQNATGQDAGATSADGGVDGAGVDGVGGAAGDGTAAGDGSATDAPAVDPGAEAAADPATDTVAPTTLPPEPLPPLAIGDSVMLGAAPQLSELGIVVDAQESRAFISGLSVVQTLAAEGRLPDELVIHLGTNGPIDSDEMQALMDATASVPEVLLITNDVDRDYTAGNNALIYDVANNYPNVKLLDWQGWAPQCEGECFYDDGLHLRPAGARFYAQLVQSVLDQ